jgi:hypothetical protein
MGSLENSTENCQLMGKRKIFILPVLKLHLESLYVPVPHICNEDTGTKRDPEISDNHSSANKLPIPRDPVQRILKVNELETGFVITHDNTQSRAEDIQALSD